MSKLHNLSQPSDNNKPIISAVDDNFLQKQFKFVILGDGAVGKTSICHRFVEDHFANSYKQTIGLDFFVKRLTLNNPNGGKVQIALQLWDIGGQSVSSKMITKYIHGANAVLLVYDITNYQTFENLVDWLQIVKQTLGSHKLPYIALVGNKYDLQHLRTVKVTRHKDMCDREKIESCYVSAKTGDGLSTMFFHIAAEIAGIKLSKNELDSNLKVISANVVNHQQNDPNQKTFQQILDKEKRKTECILL